MLFAFAAVAGSVIILYLSQPNSLLASGYYYFGLTVAREIMNTFAVRMAAVFMISTSTLFIRTGIIPRWMALLGYALALLMLLRTSQIDRLGWTSLVFPLWVLLISVYILIDNYRRKTVAAPTDIR